MSEEKPASNPINIRLKNSGKMQKESFVSQRESQEKEYATL